MAIPTVTVVGTYTDLEGNPAEGQVVFTSSVEGSSGAVSYLPTAIQAQLDTTGSFSMAIPATDSITPAFTWVVTENFAGGSSYKITLPQATVSPINIDAVTRVVS